MSNAILCPTDTPDALSGQGRVLDFLKYSTRQQHTDLETLYPLARIFSPEYTIEEYTRLLGLFLSVFSPLEALLQQKKLLRYNGYYYRPRQQDIEMDLSRLGVSASCKYINVSPILVSSKASAIGCLYVLEGSKLGGRVIARQLETTLGLSKDHGLAFFYGPQDNEPEGWKCFGKTAELICNTQESTADALAAANLTFKMLINEISNESS